MNDNALILWWEIAAIVWLIIEVVLSHTPGEASGHQSEWLARRTSLPEGTLRLLAHVVLFLVLTILVLLGWGRYGLPAVCIWSVLDEVTKIPISGRHCSLIDIGLNLVGVGIGCLVWSASRL